MNLRRVLSALLPSMLFLAAPPCGAKESTPPKPAAIARPALWKISDADTTIWLFGTIHILPAGIEWYSGPIAKALDGADTLVTEIVDPEDPGTQARVARIALSDPPRNLRESLPADLRKRYEAALTGLQLPVAAFDANDPWYAAVALSTVPLLKDGFGTMNGAEALLVAQAKGKRRVGLETAEMQLGLFDSLPQDLQIAYLREVVEGLPTVRTEVQDMVTAWKGGEAEKLARLMNEDESDPRLMKILLVDRNKAWAKWIAERMKQPGNVFIAVGAGHLAGKDSVQAQLTAYHVRAQRVR